MSDRSKPLIACRSCGMQERLCFCRDIRPIRLVTSVTVIIPRQEWMKTSNTGRLAGVCLENSRILLRGERGAVFDAREALIPDRANLILFPGGEDLSVWKSAHPGSPVNLIVPDGTWESAARILIREPVLASLVRVSVSPSAEVRTRLRKSGIRERLSTLEAVAEALSVLEGESAYASVLEVLRIKTDRVLWARGRLRTSDVYGGIPPEARSWKTASGRTPGGTA